MNIAILGAGAMGCMVASYLARAGHSVLLIDNYKAHLDKIEKDGLSMLLNGEEYTLPMRVIHPKQSYAPVDVLIVLVKALATHSALSEHRDLIGEHTVVCTLQNGLGNADVLSEFAPEDHIIKGSLRLASRLVAPGRIECTSMPGVVNVVLGAQNESADSQHAVEELAAAFTASGLNAAHHSNIDTFIWKKAVNNICINAVCGLSDLDVSKFLTHPSGKELLTACLQEVVAVAKHEGADLDVDTVLKNLYENTLPKIGHHVPSTAQDIQNRRPTEIDFLNGYISRQGKKYGILTPVNDTITALVKLKELSYQA